MCRSWEINKKNTIPKKSENFQKALVSYIKDECLKKWINVIVVKKWQATVCAHICRSWEINKKNTNPKKSETFQKALVSYIKDECLKKLINVIVVEEWQATVKVAPLTSNHKCYFIRT